MRKLILLIDDSVITHKVIELAIDNSAVELLNAYTFSSGLAVASERTPSMIILDGKLASKPDYAAKLHKIAHKAKIILLTNSYEEYTKLKDEYRADGFLLKPIDTSSLNRILSDESVSEKSIIQGVIPTSIKQTSEYFKDYEAMYNFDAELIQDIEVSPEIKEHLLSDELINLEDDILEAEKDVFVAEEDFLKESEKIYNLEQTELDLNNENKQKSKFLFSSSNSSKEVDLNSEAEESDIDIENLHKMLAESESEPESDNEPTININDVYTDSRYMDDLDSSTEDLDDDELLKDLEEIMSDPQKASKDKEELSTIFGTYLDNDEPISEKFNDIDDVDFSKFTKDDKLIDDLEINNNKEIDIDQLLNSFDPESITDKDIEALTNSLINDEELSIKLLGDTSEEEHGLPEQNSKSECIDINAILGSYGEDDEPAKDYEDDDETIYPDESILDDIIIEPDFELPDFENLPLDDNIIISDDVSDNNVPQVNELFLDAATMPDDITSDVCAVDLDAEPEISESAEIEAVDDNIAIESLEIKEPAEEIIEEAFYNPDTESYDTVISDIEELPAIEFSTTGTEKEAGEEVIEEFNEPAEFNEPEETHELDSSHEPEETHELIEALDLDDELLNLDISNLPSVEDLELNAEASNLNEEELLALTNSLVENYQINSFADNYGLEAEVESSPDDEFFDILREDDHVSDETDESDNLKNIYTMLSEDEEIVSTNSDESKTGFKRIADLVNSSSMLSKTEFEDLIDSTLNYELQKLVKDKSELKSMLKGVVKESVENVVEKLLPHLKGDK